MTREEALEWVKSEIKAPNLLKHIFAVEASSRRLAEHFGENPDYWAMAGLLHDLDYERTIHKPEKHTWLTAEWLKEKGFDEGLIYAVRAHAEAVPPKSKLDWTLFSVDPATGLVVAAALMHPSKSLAGLDVPFLMKRYKEKRFAAGARRESIAACSNLELSLEDFLGLVLDGMKRISDELGL
ncbi:MAG: phosphohydrolase [candidate division Zixibacteria bacterium RBG_16_53_22]|nr:MAG: phosphohydrolase [candidate division Zixibacteria bacterium RBG_16_53_22]